jgi:hypothetical protein
MISNATFVARWWKYKTQHQQDAQFVATQWLESGHPQPLSLTAQGSTAQEDDNETI